MTLFVKLDVKSLASFFQSASESICYAGPGIHLEPAQAMAEAARRLHPSMITVCLDFSEHVQRLGFGSIEAVQLLRHAGIVVNSARGLRTALAIADGTGYIFTPTALLLEDNSGEASTLNAMRLTDEQVAEALARLSPAAKAIAKAKASSPAERDRIDRIPLEVSTSVVSDQTIDDVSKRLAAAPPVPFDVARQVRVYNPYLQYVETKLTGAAIQRHRLKIPPQLLKLGAGPSLEGRLHTSVDLISGAAALSSEGLETTLRQIRSEFTRSLGKDKGRVILKSARRKFEECIGELREALNSHRARVAEGLQQALNESRQLIIDHYVPLVLARPPNAIYGQIARGAPTEVDARKWLSRELDCVFPKAESLLGDMNLTISYKDVTYETLTDPDFPQAIRAAFPDVDWNHAHEEFLAASEIASHDPGGRSANLP
ncbi:MAG: hypothetical protein NAOJABEB_01196 [Steroidobacteraceae bacterium]|nr:hypothetical protein [Steroidobacteraceae bacterium]